MKEKLVESEWLREIGGEKREGMRGKEGKGIGEEEEKNNVRRKEWIIRKMQ